MVLNEVLIDAVDSANYDKQLELMSVISSPMRFRIYQTLAKPMSVAELAAAFGMERKLLYYHIHVLEKHDLIEVVNTIEIGHLKKSIYKKKDMVLNVDSNAPVEVKSEAANALVTILMDITNEFRESVTKKDNHGGGVYLKSIMVKSDALKRTTAEITRLCLEMVEKIKALEDPDGDVEVKTFSAMFKK